MDSLDDLSSVVNDGSVAGTKRKLEDDNGDELEYDAAKGTWVPVVRPPTIQFRLPMC